MGRTSPSPTTSVSADSPASSNSPPPIPSPPPEQPVSVPPGPPANPNTSLPLAPSTPLAPPPQLPPTTPSPPSPLPPASPSPMASSPSNSTTSPPPQAPTPPSRTPTDPPPASSSPPPNASSPPPKSSPASPPPPILPPPQSAPPPTAPPPPPTASPPPPSTQPPPSSPPPQSSTPPTTSSPPPPEPPKSAPSPPKPPESSPPPPSTNPPKNSPSPPSPEPPKKSPPPPATKPPQSSPPPPPASDPPENSPPSPALGPPSNSSRPPISTPTPPSNSPPSPGSPPRSSAPPPIRQLSPPPSLLSPPSSSSSLVPPDAPSNKSITAPDSSNSEGGGGIGTGGAVAIGLVLSFLLLGAIGTAVWFLWKRNKKAPRSNAGYVMPTSLGSSPKSESALLKVQVSATNAGSDSGRGFGSSPSEPGGLGNSRSWFTYEELAEATTEFSEQNLLGEGGFGSVYKGYLADGREVAVKQLKDGGGQGEREFRAEVEIISRVHHRHLVSLVGYCISEKRRLLVYDYVPNNTLHFHLHGQGRPVLDWAARTKIAVGAARGIAYLHEDCHPRIIHRDIKSSNILLDNNFDARVSDFGLAKLFLDTNTHVTTRVMGTFGYMAPEYASSGKLTDKSDVFSFGVVLLELITGRKPVDTSQPLGDESLVEWARPLLSHALDTEEFEGLVDPRLGKNYIGGEMFRMIEAAAACVRHSSAKRPRMTQILRAFDSLSISDLTNGMRVGESEMFNSAQQSAEIRLFRRMAFGSQDYSTDFFSQGTWNHEER